METLPILDGSKINQEASLVFLKTSVKSSFLLLYVQEAWRQKLPECYFEAPLYPPNAKFILTCLLEVFA